MMNQRPYTLDRVVRLGLSGAVLVGLVWLLSYLSDVLMPFAAALVLAYMLNPLVEVLQRLVKSRLAAVLLSLVLCLSAGAALLWWVVPLVGQEISRAAVLVRELANNSELAQKAATQLPDKLWPLIQSVLDRPAVKDFLGSSDMWSVIGSLARKILPGLWGLLSQVGSIFAALAGLVVVLLYMFFLMLDLDAISRGWRESIPPAYRQRTLELVDDFNNALRNYFRAQAAVAGLVGILFAIGFVIIGLPLGILLGLLMGLFNMVPYLQLVGLVPAFFLALLAVLQTGGSIWPMLGLTAGVFAVVQVIQDTILTPRIVGRTMSLSPAFLLLSLSVWGKLLGFLGLLLAIPFTCLAWAWYQRFVVKKGSENQQTLGF
ncbi:MAG: AI-2E family transporter [Desulfarculaceae bacterium]|nr:AI-2E family transporter [Desulfarculaceae bacterium]MCF8047389.1 AI-2E family transporter [Desulfarculaceae bacterium]MCF8096651.1 AI-2E family transporter [Desulfarculaceae bacterium]